MDKTYGNIINLTKNNNNYRYVLHTEKNFQLILQSLLREEDVPEESHDDSVQFIFCVNGSGIVTIDDEPNTLTENIFCIVPVGKKHSINPTSDIFKFYTIYNSIEHNPKVIEKRQTKRYLVGDKYAIMRDNNTNNWSFYYKDNERLCSHEFKNIKKLANEILPDKPCPICNHCYPKDQ